MMLSGHKYVCRTHSETCANKLCKMHGPSNHDSIHKNMLLMVNPRTLIRTVGSTGQQHGHWFHVGIHTRQKEQGDPAYFVLRPSIHLNLRSYSPTPTTDVRNNSNCSKYVVARGPSTRLMTRLEACTKQQVLWCWERETSTQLQL